MTRRTLLRSSALAAAAAVPASANWKSTVVQNALPRWRGFNLLDLFQALPERGGYPPPITEDECRWMRDWGFNFIRIPIDYWFYIDSDWKTTRKLTPEETVKISDSALEPLDRIVELGRRFGLHVNINLHRAPGYCINNTEREPFSLWKDHTAEEAFVFHWDFLARRYRGVSPLELSFNLVNEAPSPRDEFMSKADYYRVMTHAAGAIKQVSPERIILIDGYGAGGSVADNLVETGLHQSVHAYWPARISHYRAAWVDRKLDFPEPAWPIMNESGNVEVGRSQLEARFVPWGEVARKGIGIHCGEFGCFNRTPHPIALAWLKDVLEVLEMYGIGWAMWNLRGTFGILNSGRSDVMYEGWYGTRLDQQLLALLQAH